MSCSVISYKIEQKSSRVRKGHFFVVFLVRTETDQSVNVFPKSYAVFKHLFRTVRSRLAWT
jgi:hypothetical protein